MRNVVVIDPTIEIPANEARHKEMAYVAVPEGRAALLGLPARPLPRLLVSDLWIQYPDGKKKLLLSLPRYDFNWQRDYTFAEPIKVPAGSKLIAHYVYDNSKRNPANPDPKIKVTWGEQSLTRRCCSPRFATAGSTRPRTHRVELRRRDAPGPA